MTVIRTVLAAVLLLVTLTACGQAAQQEVPAMSTPSAAPTPSVTPPVGLRVDEFIVAFRTADPDLTEGRTNKAISNDARNTCASVTAGETQAFLIRAITARFVTPSGRAPTRAEALGILAMLKANGCPTPKGTTR